MHHITPIKRLILSSCLQMLETDSGEENSCTYNKICFTSIHKPNNRKLFPNNVISLQLTLTKPPPTLPKSMLLGVQYKDDRPSSVHCLMSEDRTASVEMGHRKLRRTRRELHFVLPNVSAVIYLPHLPFLLLSLLAVLLRLLLLLIFPSEPAAKIARVCDHLVCKREMLLKKYCERFRLNNMRLAWGQ